MGTRDDAVAVRITDNGLGTPGAELAGITTDEEPTQLTHGTGFGLRLVRSSTTPTPSRTPTPAAS